MSYDSGGRIELDDSMTMILTAKKIDFYNSDRTKLLKVLINFYSFSNIFSKAVSVKLNN